MEMALDFSPPKAVKNLKLPPDAVTAPIRLYFYTHAGF